MNQPELSIVIPCLNEEETLGKSIEMALTFIRNHQVETEIIVADNGSTDNSVAIAEQMGARVVHVKEKGYGNALRGGIDAAKGGYIIMGDADNSHDFTAIYPFIEKLRDGYELIVGNRFKGGISKGAMSFKNRYIGNPILSFLGRLFFKTNIRDFHSGLRGFTKDAYNRMNLQTSGMEFASEMIVKASFAKLKTTEVPIIMYPDMRSRAPHLKPWRDGWRHLRFLLLYSPRWLFLIPGFFLMMLGFLGFFYLSIEDVSSNILLNYLPLSAGIFLIGFQFVTFYGLTKVYAVSNNLLPKSNRYDSFFEFFTLEKGIFFGFLSVLFGIGLFWFSVGSSGDMPGSVFLKTIIPSVVLMLLGVQVILFGFFFSILGLKKK